MERSVVELKVKRNQRCVKAYSTISPALCDWKEWRDSGGEKKRAESVTDFLKEGIREFLQGQRCNPWAWMWKSTLDDSESSLFCNFPTDNHGKYRCRYTLYAMKINQDFVTFILFGYVPVRESKGWRGAVSKQNFQTLPHPWWFLPVLSHLHRGWLVLYHGGNILHDLMLHLCFIAFLLF